MPDEKSESALEEDPVELTPDGLNGIAWRLLETGPDAMVVVNEAGRIVFVNQRAECLFGYARKELLGTPIESLIPERFRSSHVELRRAFTRESRTRAMGSGLELLGRRSDGSEFPVEISLSPVKVLGRALTSANVRDVTERKGRELARRRLQAHLLSAIESIPASFAIFDAMDRLVVANSACRYLLGRHLEREAIGCSFDELLDANLAGGTFAAGESSAAELRARWSSYHRAPNGALRLRTSDNRELSVVEGKTAEGGTVTTIWDVTAEVEREAELVRTRSLAEAASSAKSEFLASVTHELRTPLNAILGFAQLLKRDKKTPLPERHVERVDHVLTGGEHLLRLIDDVLDFARIEAGHISISLEPVIVAEVLADVKATLGPMAQRAEVVLEFPLLAADSARVLADRTRFKQILLNYGSNAIKYGRQRGTVAFRVRQGEGSWIVSVVDDGIGIPLDKQDRIFMPFQRAGQETGSIEGTGIGLAISKHLAESMAGRVGFCSGPGKGSEFWVELPIAERAHVPDPREAREELNLFDGRGPRYSVVYIEDNPSSIAFMKDLLDAFDRVELLTAPTAEVGLELVRAHRPNVVLMDIHLPGMNGFEALQRLKQWQETRDIPVVALSAAAVVRDAERVRQAGFHRYLTKPLKVDEFARVLREVLQHDDAPPNASGGTAPADPSFPPA